METQRKAGTEKMRVAAHGPNLLGQHGTLVVRKISPRGTSVCPLIAAPTFFWVASPYCNRSCCVSELLLLPLSRAALFSCLLLLLYPVPCVFVAAWRECGGGGRKRGVGRGAGGVTVSAVSIPRPPIWRYTDQFDGRLLTPPRFTSAEKTRGLL